MDTVGIYTTRGMHPNGLPVAVREDKTGLLYPVIDAVDLPNGLTRLVVGEPLPEGTEIEGVVLTSLGPHTWSTTGNPA
jgi:hypothetical protein